jgi:hypothetical protein
MDYAHPPSILLLVAGFTMSCICDDPDCKELSDKWSPGHIWYGFVTISPAVKNDKPIAFRKRLEACGFRYCRTEAKGIKYIARHHFLLMHLENRIKTFSAKFLTRAEAEKADQELARLGIPAQFAVPENCAASVLKTPYNRGKNYYVMMALPNLNHVRIQRSQSTIVLPLSVAPPLPLPPLDAAKKCKLCSSDDTRQLEKADGSKGREQVTDPSLGPDFDISQWPDSRIAVPLNNNQEGQVTHKRILQSTDATCSDTKETIKLPEAEMPLLPNGNISPLRGGDKYEQPIMDHVEMKGMEITEPILPRPLMDAACESEASDSTAPKRRKSEVEKSVRKSPGCKAKPQLQSMKEEDVDDNYMQESDKRHKDEGQNLDEDHRRSENISMIHVGSMSIQGPSASTQIDQHQKSMTL